MKMITIILLSMLMVLVLSCGFVQAPSTMTSSFSKGDDKVNITYQLQNDKICGRAYTPNCIFNSDTVERYKKIDYLKEWQENITDYKLECTNTTYCDEKGCIYPQTCKNIISGSHMEDRCGWYPITMLDKTSSKKTFDYFDINSGGCHLVWKQFYDGSLVLSNIQITENILKSQLDFSSKTLVDVIPSITLGSTTFEMKEMAWWNNGWKKSKNIDLNSSIEGLTNYQVRMLLPLSTEIGNGKIASNCGDLRFVNSTGQEIPYYIEICASSGNSIIWVKSIQLNDTITMYYNSTTTATTSSISTTFDVYWTSDENTGWNAYDPSGNCKMGNDLVNKRLNWTGCSRTQSYGWAYYTTTPSTVNFTVEFATSNTASFANGVNVETGFNDGAYCLNGDGAHCTIETYGVSTGVWPNANMMMRMRYDDGTYYSDPYATLGVGTTYYVRLIRAGTLINVTYFTDNLRTTRVAGTSWQPTYTSATRAFTTFNMILAGYVDHNVGDTRGWVSNLTVGKYSGGTVNVSVKSENDAPPSDTCTYSSGNWDVQCADNCVITSGVNMAGGYLTINGTGIFKMNADISKYGMVFIRGGCSVMGTGRFKE